MRGGALALARTLDRESAVGTVVRTLAACGDTALARLWLLAPGDVCVACPMRTDCPDQTRCLHLAASAGNPRQRGADWSGIGGSFRRVPLGVGKIGRVGASRSAVLLHDMSQRSSWIADPAWAAREGIRGFAAHPLLCAGQVLGVLAVFLRRRIDATAFQDLRVLADHAAAAVARARAVAEVERGRAAAERENAALKAELRRKPTVPALPIPETPVLSAAEWRQHERANLAAALRRSGGRIYGGGGAAELLGVPPTTLASRVKALGVAVPGRRGTAPS
jgi:transcriptional regulator with GAF, ATPase, and Fis domain